MQIDTSALASLKAFNSFVTASASKDSDIVRIATGRPEGAPLKIVKATGDRAWWALSRSEASKVDNNAVRAAFKSAVEKLFGGEDKIPESVKKEMKLNDYGKGRPLTARRITAVSTAIIQTLRKEGITDQNGKVNDLGAFMGKMGFQSKNMVANQAVFNGMSSREPISKSGLPPEFAKALRNILDDAHTRYVGPLKNEPTPQDFVLGGAASKMRELVNAANREDRRVTTAEFTAVMKPLFMRHAVAAAIQNTLNAKAKEMGMETVNTYMIAKRHPEIVDDLLSCKSHDEVTSCFEKYSETIQNTLNQVKEVREYKDRFVTMVKDAVLKEVGELNVDFGGSTPPFTSKIDKLADSILTGENMDAKRTDYDLGAEVSKVVNSVAKGFIDRCREIDDLASKGEISTNVAKRWKEDLVSSGNANDFVPTTIVAMTKKLDPKLLFDAFKPENNTETALKSLKPFVAQIEQAGTDVFGRRGWKEAGPETRDMVRMRIMDVLFDKVPNLKEAVLSRSLEMRDKYEDVLVTTLESQSGAKVRGGAEDYDLAHVLFGTNKAGVNCFDYLNVKAGNV